MTLSGWGCSNLGTCTLLFWHADASDRNPPCCFSIRGVLCAGTGTARLGSSERRQANYRVRNRTAGPGSVKYGGVVSVVWTQNVSGWGSLAGKDRLLLFLVFLCFHCGHVESKIGKLLELLYETYFLLLLDVYYSVSRSACQLSSKTSEKTYVCLLLLIYSHFPERSCSSPKGASSCQTLRFSW